MIKEELNNKPHFSKIFISGFVDFIFFLVIAFLANNLVFSSPISNNYRDYHEQMVIIQDTYKLEVGYGDKVYVDSASEVISEDLQRYEDSFGTYVVINHSEISELVKTEYSERLKTDEVYQILLREYQVSSISLLFLVIGSTQLVLFFIVPISNKRRATLGKLIFGLKNVQTNTNQPVVWYFILIQYILIAIFASILPYLFLGEMAIVFSPLFILAFMLFSPNYQSMHQWITRVQTVLNKVEESEEKAINEIK